MWLELLNFILGLAFGFSHRGEEDYTGIMRNGVIIGTFSGILFVLIAMFVVPEGLSIDTGFLGVLGVFVEIFLFVVIFILGAFIGDRLEGAVKK
jgi:hypothetical protein